jgi:uncharacterized protein (TIGR02118 family)
MIKRISLLQRKAGMSVEAFNRHWFDIHGPLALSVPGVRRYIQNHIHASSSRADIPDINIDVDGIAELWWDDEAAMKVSTATPQAKALFADGALFIGRVKTYVIEEKAIIGEV